VTDCDEYGRPVADRYQRLGASGNQEGMYVRFEPGFGLNVHIGYRLKVLTTKGTFNLGPYEHRDKETIGMALSIEGWERLGELVDEWRARESQQQADG
jgi:hypothetical protein